MAPHPLAQLTAEELKTIAQVAKSLSPNKKLSFRRIYLAEPEKALVVPYLKAELAGTPLPKAPPRIGQALYYFDGEEVFVETLVDIGSRRVISHRVLEGMHGPGDDEEMIRVQEATLASPIVQKELERLQLPAECEVIAEPWPYGTDDTPVSGRWFQVWMFINTKRTKHTGAGNFYGHPLDFTVVVDGRDMSVVRIDRMPLSSELVASEDPKARYQENPDSEYTPSMLPSLRRDLKPLNVIQPEGVSFSIEQDGQTVHWQKWKFTLNFDLREGMVLRNITYEGRPIFYRLALSEMTVPYGDPRSPLQRKSAYDLGEAGAGQTANNLQLGCDCLGVIHYFDGLGCSPDGEPVVLPNTICMHEQDAGISWKHTNVRTGKADVTRSRELLLQLILTVGNYEYILQFIFDTAGSIHWEVRATGIMSVTPVDLDANASEMRYGTIVAPGVFAPHHQHIFNIRIDPAIDGYDESEVIYDEVLPMPRDEKNPHGVGFQVHTTKIQKESAFDLDWRTNRVVKMVNPKKLNPYSGKPVGWKIMCPPTQLGLADVTSMHNIRGEFINNHIHVTKHNDKEMYAAGEFPWQSVGGQGGCRTWSSRQRDLALGDSVVWLTIGFTHTARSEDWPVMPAECFRMSFKPVGFFSVNPALDVAPSTQLVNKSTKAVPGKPDACCKKANL
ncbi:primary amine oxidase [Meredithblackwellia eburnea MCA 4105]